MYYNKNNDVERILKEDNRDKRSSGRGAMHNSGRRGGGVHGIKQGIRMPSDVLKANDKVAYKKYIANGEVKMSNLYTDIKEIPSLAEIRVKDFKVANNILTIAKSNNTMKVLMNHWGVASGTLYSIFNEYNVVYPRRVSKKKIIPVVHTVVEENFVEQSKLLEQAELLKNSEEEKVQANEIYEALVKKNKQVNDRYEVMLAEQTTIQIKLRTLIETKDTEFALYKEEQQDKIMKQEVAMSGDEEDFEMRYCKRDISGPEIQADVMKYISVLNKSKKYDVKLTVRELPELVTLVLPSSLERYGEDR